ncbi:DgyrCDS3452 [Dimorphilus gyrociliatus]|uniref:DgyrCDS3452 n=1 Tax=Dimorphilus gyrociliatus TaxID=2664684 RepID=A0A7I8VD82_9ANNE|nr:DgyrCDS3452 [Dimorphilus gyrociliatus]
MMSEEYLPIDIHFNKLLDWLINRRHCKQQWQKDALIVREKINSAIQDMPEVDSVTKLLQGTYINYFHCIKIIEILKETEKETKNIFGRYSSQRMKDWQEIVSLYEKDNLYLAEAAQLLARNVNYDIPSLKKKLSKLRQNQKEFAKKESDYAGISSERMNKFKIETKKIGIEGRKLKTELTALSNDLPQKFNEIASEVKELKPAYEYYKNFTEFLSGEKSKDKLSMLRLILEKGNCTVYEWKFNEIPNSIEISDETIAFDDEEEKDTEEIDWGNINEDPSAETIDFSAITIEGGGQEIDYGDNNDSKGIETIKSEEGVARGCFARGVLDYGDSRNLFLNDIYEVCNFKS